MSHGHGDPSLPAEAMVAHDQAVARGLQTYRDPATGYQVLTTTHLLAVGECCGQGCRHCPFPADQQRKAGRPSVRPE